MSKINIARFDLIILSAFLQSFSFLSIKYASMSDEYSLILLVVAFGFIIYRAYIWQIILKYNELSKVYPFNSLVQVLIFFYAITLFNENVTFWHVFGLILIISGLSILKR